jgi:hypothetical protein
MTPDPIQGRHWARPSRPLCPKRFAPVIERRSMMLPNRSLLSVTPVQQQLQSQLHLPFSYSLTARLGEDDNLLQRGS